MTFGKKFFASKWKARRAFSASVLALLFSLSIAPKALAAMDWWKVFEEKIMKVHLDMSKEEVIKILDTPYKRSLEKNSQGETIETLYYRETALKSPKSYIIYKCTLLNGRLQSISSEEFFEDRLIVIGADGKFYEFQNGSCHKLRHTDQPTLQKNAMMQ